MPRITDRRFGKAAGRHAPLIRGVVELRDRELRAVHGPVDRTVETRAP